MKQQRLNLYLVDIKYIRDLARADDHVMSVSPQIGKSTRPFIGIIVICNDKQYCVPLSSPKPKHVTMKNDKDFTKIYDGERLIAVLNFNEMIPVNEGVICPLDMRPRPSDTKNSLQSNWIIAVKIRRPLSRKLINCIRRYIRMGPAVI